MLGICFGGQALAVALGGTIERSPVPEIGWQLVESLGDVVPGGPWFQFHYDRFTYAKEADARLRAHALVDTFLALPRPFSSRS